MKKLALLIVLVFTLSFSFVLAENLTTATPDNVLLSAPENNAEQPALNTTSDNGTEVLAPETSGDVTTTDNGNDITTPDTTGNDVTTPDTTENNASANVDTKSNDTAKATDNSLLGAIIAIVIVIAVVAVVALIQKK
jgi:cobalamin biosynthesis Mg chelatase CobN